MSFGIEKLIIVNLYCFKCDKLLETYIPKNFEEIIMGGAIYKCDKCGYKVAIKEG